MLATRGIRRIVVRDGFPDEAASVGVARDPVNIATGLAITALGGSTSPASR